MRCRWRTWRADALRHGRRLSSSFAPASCRRSEGRVPDAAAYDAFASWLERELDRAAAANPNPGWNPLFHRLNRAEYQNVVRDLLAVQVDVGSLLPADDASYGFDNMAGVLRMSPTLMERYLSAAQKVGRLAVGTPVLTPDAELYRVPDDLPQEQHLDGLPFGTRGGTIDRARVSGRRRVRDQGPAGTRLRGLRARVARRSTARGQRRRPPRADCSRCRAKPLARRSLTSSSRRAPNATGPRRRHSAGQKPARDRQQIRLEAEQRSKRQQERKRIDADWQVRLPITAGSHMSWSRSSRKPMRSPRR